MIKNKHCQRWPKKNYDPVKQYILNVVLLINIGFVSLEKLNYYAKYQIKYQYFIIMKNIIYFEMFIPLLEYKLTK